MSKRRTLLFKPDIEKLKREDRSFTHVIEERRSKREHGNNPITLKQLGEFLFRAARMKEHLIYPKGESHGAELSRRPYPGGGAIYELELYLVIYKCQGLEKGIYHYHPREHALYQLEAEQKNIDALLRDSMHSSGKENYPQVFFIITSRFQRMSWKYRSMAYAATLKTTGVLLQTMYLVATAMDLAPCAIGGGNSDLFSETIGTNYLEETSVGEFMLGSREQ
jgi:SagB-type dehydrogenase family enzyme